MHRRWVTNATPCSYKLSVTYTEVDMEFTNDGPMMIYLEPSKLLEAGELLKEHKFKYALHRVLEQAVIVLPEQPHRSEAVRLLSWFHSPGGIVGISGEEWGRLKLDPVEAMSPEEFNKQYMCDFDA